MLFLLFQLGRDRYAIDAAQVVEILPLLRMKEIPRAATGVAGAFNYHGAPVPVVDLSLLALGHPASERLSTRIVLVRVPDGDGEPRLLGLIAERATETLRRDPGDFSHPGVTADRAPYLGPVLPDARGLIQWIEVDRLLSPSVRRALFRDAGEDATCPDL